MKLVYRLHAGRVFHRTGAAALVGQTLHAAGVGGLDGQGEDEPAPLALLALHPYLAAGEVDQHLADVQAETCAPGVETPGLVFFVEALEDVGQRLGADALTGVPDGDFHLRAQPLHPEADGAACRGELDGAT